MTTTHEPEGHRDDGGGPAAEPAGTVAEEAALLVELLSRRGWGAGGGMPPTSSQPPSGRGEQDASGNGHRTSGTPAAEPVEDAERADAQQAHECTCGGREPAACRVCPVCQLISFVQQVNPDTIERVADFVGFAATALRDLATAQRERSTRSETANEEQEGRA